ncbi:hypothetical protein DSC45_28080 [Streptomyces sp. YIM 130001]|uniref:Asp23/Gls24 family envelope stress response protein n=1 Tax=Streptomyces sp. YIM 130001 TaxID=2259644 RepID=UPI000EDD2922|nr:Asp23/Gls24 family envelope stress response protein [Streptomyces sp. YIM 130001]RII11774.1 hypothetical protein DSC45_28080 [Streptomyces sp. YIM 130001]
MTAHTDPPDPYGGSDDERLPCGRLLSEVSEAWEDRTEDTHLDTCPYCRQAVEDLERLGSAVRSLREEGADEAPYDSSTIVRRVMDVVRLELRPGRPLPLGEPDEDLWIMESVAARSLRAAAETVPGVRAGSCRLRPVPGDGADGGTVELRLEIHAPSQARLPALADEVRTRVREAMDGALGMEVSAVDIRITDLVDEPADSGDAADLAEVVDLADAVDLAEVADVAGLAGAAGTEHAQEGED